MSSNDAGTPGRGLIRWGYYALVVILVLLAIYGIWMLFLPLFFGFLLSYMLSPMVDSLERFGLKRSLATMLILGSLVLLTYTVLKSAYPRLSRQAQDIQHQLPRYRAHIDAKMETLREQLSQKLPGDIVDDVFATTGERLSNNLETYKKLFPHILGEILSTITLLLFAPVVAFFFLIQGSEIKKHMVSLIPNRYFEMVLMLIYRLDIQLGSYLRGQLLDCIGLGVMAIIGLSLLQVKYAVFIGAFAGLANVVPYIGPIAGALPGMLVLLLDPNAAFPWWSIIILFVVIKAIDDVFLYPMTVGKSLELHPLLVILGILAGEHVAGVLGMLVAIPLLGMTKTAMEVLHSSLKSYRII